MEPRDDGRRKRLPRWLRPQFGLRSLLLFMLVICLSLGWHVERVRRQRLAVAALTEAGALIGYGEDDPFGSHFPDRIENPQTLGEWVEWSTPRRLRTALGIDFFRGVQSVDSGPETDLASDMRYLRDLPGLRSLTLDFVLDEDLVLVGSLGSLTYFDASDSRASNQGQLSITDAGLVRLGQLQNLEYLDLSNNSITDAGFARLAKLKRLKHLAIRNTNVGDAGISNLADMRDLEFLDLGATKVTNDGLLYLAKLRRLKHLDLYWTEIGDAGLAILAKLPNLEFLGVGETGVTDQGLAPLRSLASLKELVLTATAISDKGLRVIGDMRSLNRVQIGGAEITAEGAAWLGRRLPKIEVWDYGADRESAAFGRVHKLMEAGRWREALGAINKLDKSVVEQYAYYEFAALMVARCHAELGHWDLAAHEFRKALDQLPDRRLEPYSYASTVWQELDAWPPVYERVARSRPNDVWRWIASAQRAVIEGRWSAAAADYARAMKCPHEVVNVFAANHVGTYTHIEFEYGASRILADDLPEHGHVSARLIEAHQQAVQKNAKWANGSKNNLIVAVHLWLLAPQGAVSASQIAAWSNDRATHSFAFEELEPLVDCRAGMFQKVLEQERSTYEVDCGRFWFSCAMAHDHLGHDSEARKCFTRGTLWLDRLTKAVRIHRRYDAAGCLLEAEVLRREAKRLIFN